MFGCVCTAQDDYHDISTKKGDSVSMWCNTTKSSEMNWTRTTTDDVFMDVYINGQFVYNPYSRYSIVNHNLSIYNAQIRDSGHWDCYDSGEVKCGYEPNITGEKLIFAEVVFFFFLNSTTRVSH